MAFPFRRRADQSHGPHRVRAPYGTPGLPGPSMAPEVTQSPALTEWELWACANELVRQHGADAPIHAAIRADELFEAGDDAGARTFRLIVKRAEELLKPASGARH